MTYDLMVLVSPTLDMTDAAAQKNLVTKLVGSESLVKDVSSLGKKTLEYPIRKYTEATYLLATLEGSVKVGDITKKAKLMDEVVRFLLTKRE